MKNKAEQEIAAVDISVACTGLARRLNSIKHKINLLFLSIERTILPHYRLLSVLLCWFISGLTHE
jgi:hypothetical protein